MSGKAAATETAKQLSVERQAAEERLQEAAKKVSELEVSDGVLREELAEARRGAGAVKARLEASVAANKVYVWGYEGGLACLVGFSLAVSASSVDCLTRSERGTYKFLMPHSRVVLAVLQGRFWTGFSLPGRRRATRAFRPPGKEE